MQRYLLFAAFGWLAFSGIMHFAIDVVSHALQGRHPPGRETTLYYGLQSAFALGKAAFGLLGVLLAWRAPLVAGSAPVMSLSLLAGAAWLTIAFLFIDYRQPQFAAAMFLFLLIAATFARAR
jgi:hypothetical protein